MRKSFTLYKIIPLNIALEQAASGLNTIRKGFATVEEAEGHFQEYIGAHPEDKNDTFTILPVYTGM